MDKEDVIIVSTAVVILVALVVFSFVFIFVEKEQIYIVKGCSWGRDIEIEKNTLCTEEGWYVPHGATEIDRWTELRGYDSVWVGTDKDGNAEYMSVPDYDTRYRYTIWRYLHERTAFAGGLKELEETPVWPEVKLKEKERQGTRTETYTIHLQADKEILELVVPFSQWNQLSRGSIVLGHKNIFNDLRRIDLAEAG